MLNISLRTKFLLSLALISSALSSVTLLLVRQRVTLHVRHELAAALQNSVTTFQSMQHQREEMLSRSAALLAELPPLKAVMMSRDRATIQDASVIFWKLIKSQLFVLYDASGQLMALHTTSPRFTADDAQNALRNSLRSGPTTAWWEGNGHLFEVSLQPIYFGSQEQNLQIGILAVGYEIDDHVTADIARVAASRVAFRYGDSFVVSTIAPGQWHQLGQALRTIRGQSIDANEIQLGSERFLAASVSASAAAATPVTLTVLKSFDQATAFLTALNRWILAVGLAAVLAGSALVFLVSTAFTRPLADLVAGVRALERNDYAFPLHVRGADEVSTLTAAFAGMRTQLLETQQQLLDAERLATIGRMASTISHDLRHPLTAILAYAEFLADRDLTPAQRLDFFEEIRIAVTRMTDEINSLLSFSKQREPIHTVRARLAAIVERAFQCIRILPEFQSISLQHNVGEHVEGWFDPAKLERVLLNLLFNACEAVCPVSGVVELTAQSLPTGLHIWVADNGPGIPESIRENLFQPFVSYGKEKGIGLGLTVVRKIMQDHGGKVNIVRTGSSGTVFELVFPLAPAASCVPEAQEQVLS